MGGDVGDVGHTLYRLRTVPGIGKILSLVHLEWAFSEAAVGLLKKNAEDQVFDQEKFLVAGDILGKGATV